MPIYMPIHMSIHMPIPMSTPCRSTRRLADCAEALPWFTDAQRTIGVDTSACFCIFVYRDRAAQRRQRDSVLGTDTQPQTVLLKSKSSMPAASLSSSDIQPKLHRPLPSVAVPQPAVHGSAAVPQPAVHGSAAVPRCDSALLVGDARSTSPAQRSEAAEMHDARALSSQPSNEATEPRHRPPSSHAIDHAIILVHEAEFLNRIDSNKKARQEAAASQGDAEAAPAESVEAAPTESVEAAPAESASAIKSGSQHAESGQASGNATDAHKRLEAREKVLRDALLKRVRGIEPATTAVRDWSTAVREWSTAVRDSNGQATTPST